ncbi:MAG: hypothetical protein NZ898_15945, partial [Myxococcota bacterium]|nr:hypothetical protein [Myxococcota bacterium]
SGDVCTAGRCGGSAITCNDANPCTRDGCEPDRGCVFVGLADGTACDDGNACTTGDACDDFVCVGRRRTCDDGNPCTSDRCDPGSGCVHEPVRDGTSCDDGNACTLADACRAGRCEGGTTRVCLDPHACTADSCNPATGMCVFTPDDSRCDDGNVCTADRCDPARGCVSSPVRDGMRCDDGNVCTVEDACRGGTCTGRARSCDDGIRCTVDSCDPGRGGCVHTPQDRLCDDGDDCTVDRCLPTAGCVYASIC